jgi:hypothetical protein
LAALARPGLWIFLFYLVLSILLFLGSWISAGHSLPFGDVDVREVTWFMGWTPYALSHGQTPLLTTHIDYPDGVNLMWNTAMNLPAFVLWPVTTIFGPIVSTTAAITLALPLSAWATYLAARRYASRPAAVIAGLVFGFSPLMISQSAGHIHMTLAVFPPLALLALDEILVRQRRSPWLVGGGLGLASAAQLLIGEEVFALTVILAAIGVVVLAVRYRRLIRPRLPYIGKAALAAGGVFLVLAAYPLSVQFFGPLQVHGVLPDAYWTDIYALVVPTRWQALQLAPELADRLIRRNIVELGGAFIGLPLLLISLWVTVRMWSRDLVRIASIIAVLATVLALGDHLHRDGHGTRWPLPWALLEHLPLLQNVAPPRFMLFTYLMVALLLALFVDWVIARPRGGLRWAGFGLTGLALIALFPAVPYPTDPVVVPAFFNPGGDVGRIPDGNVVLVAPFSRSFTADAMMWQSVARMSFRMPEGYAYRPGPTRIPPESALQTQLNAIYYGLDRPSLTTELIQQMRGDLERMGVTAVVVGPEPREQEVVALFRGLLIREPVETGGVFVWWSVS